MSNYGTWPPTMGHRVIVVDIVDGAVRVTVGRVTAYACGEDATGEYRSLSLRLADGRPATCEAVGDVFDLDGMYSYGTSDAAVAAVRDAISGLARALLPPKAGATVEPVAVQADDPVEASPPVEEPV